MLTKLKKSISFEKWCISNNRLDILSRWDYEINTITPKDISYGVQRKYYFKCPRGIHKSELKDITSFTSGQEGSMYCNRCSSFAQVGIDAICEDFLEKYWDYNKNIVDPWEISYGSSKMVWIKCQEKEYHESYEVACCNFFLRDSRCSYCGNFKVHSLDSLGVTLENKNLLHIWSDENKLNPYQYSPWSSKEVQWKCESGEHNDYFRKIALSNDANFRCPNCQFSIGEKISENYFKLKIINYIPQKEFEGLLGLGYGNLSYDFYLPTYNILYEFQGEQHERYIPYFHKSIEDFEKQVEHDRRKKEYAIEKGYIFLEIWYWDINNIEEILDTYLVKKEGK